MGRTESGVRQLSCMASLARVASLTAFAVQHDYKLLVFVEVKRSSMNPRADLLADRPGGLNVDRVAFVGCRRLELLAWSDNAK